MKKQQKIDVHMSKNKNCIYLIYRYKNIYIGISKTKSSEKKFAWHCAVRLISTN